MKLVNVNLVREFYTTFVLAFTYCLHTHSRSWQVYSEARSIEYNGTFGPNLSSSLGIYCHTDKDHTASIVRGGREWSDSHQNVSKVFYLWVDGCHQLYISHFAGIWTRTEKGQGSLRGDKIWHMLMSLAFLSLYTSCPPPSRPQYTPATNLLVLTGLWSHCCM